MEDNKEEKEFFIYSFKKFNGKFDQHAVALNVLLENILKHQNISYCTCYNNLRWIYILTKKLPGNLQLLITKYFKPRWLKHESSITIPWKKRSKNKNHIITNSYGREIIIGHYAERIIKELKRLELI